MSRAILLVILLTASRAWAAPVFDAASIAGAESVLSISHNHTSTGINRSLISCISVQDPATTVTSTYNAVATSPVADITSAGGQRLYMRSLIGPSSGTNQHTAAATDLVNIMVVVMTFVDVHQVTPLGTAASTADVAPPVTVSPSSTVTDLVADCSNMIFNVPDQTLGAGQTDRADFNNASLGQFTSSTKAGAAGTTAVSRDWAGGSTEYVGLIGVAIKEAAAAGGGATIRRRVISE
jgi:hypothetical protein